MILGYVFILFDLRKLGLVSAESEGVVGALR